MAFQIKNSPLPDGTFTAAGVTAWTNPLVISGADVGGIPYCPTAASIVTSSGFVFNASGVAGDGLAISAGTATTDVQALSVTQTWNNPAIAFTGHKYVVTDTASAAGALHSAWYGGAAGTTALMTLDKAATLTIGSGSGSSQGWVFKNRTNGFSSIYPTGVSQTFGNEVFESNGGAATYVSGNNSSSAVVLQYARVTIATFAQSLVTIASGVDLKLGNAYVATPPTASGYVILKDSTGTSYKILVST